MKVLKRLTPTRRSESWKPRNDVDLAFTDAQMPGTRDGIELSHDVRDRWPPVKLIVASGTAIIEESNLPPEAGFLYAVQ